MKYSRQTRRRKRDQMEETLNTQDQTPETTDGFLEGLDDMEPTADQPEIPSETTQDSAPHEKTKAESGEEPQPAQEPPAEAEEGPAEEPPKTWTLQHLGESRTVNEAEMTALAQKGLDYDRPVSYTHLPGSQSLAVLPKGFRGPLTLQY